MNKKRNKSVKPRKRRRKSYAQKHPYANRVSSSSQETEDNVSKIVIIIILIIVIVSLLVYLIQGGQPGYDWYPNRHRYR